MSKSDKVQSMENPQGAPQLGKTCPLRSGTNQDDCFQPILINIVLEVLARAAGQGNELKGIVTRKEKVLLNPLVDMILCIGNQGVH